MALIDPFGREITYLRVSVTDRCNLRCRYCMPEDVEFMEADHLLKMDEIARIIRVCVGEGIRKVRITGGEPLARQGVVGLIEEIAEEPGLKEIALSTNAVLLEQQAAALKDVGLQRVNISLDTLRPDRFTQITGSDRWHAVKAGINAALAAGLHPVKVNAVLLARVNDDEIGDFVEWALREPVHIRFIEYMPVGTFETWDRSNVVPNDYVLAAIRDRAAIEPIERDLASAGPAREWRLRLPNGEWAPGSVGLITAVTDEFCVRCNRIRLTSDGKLRGCLLSNGEVDLRAPLRAGINDAELRELLLQCIRQKPEKHYINEPELLAAPAYQMHQMGG